MIRLLDERTKRFVDFLNTNHGTKEEVSLSILHGYDAVASDETGGKGFAVYLPPLKVILLPSDVPQEVLDAGDEELSRNFVIHNLAHEYAHFLQDVGVLDGFEDEDAIEDIAEDFADKAVAEFEQLERQHDCSTCKYEEECDTPDFGTLERCKKGHEEA